MALGKSIKMYLTVFVATTCIYMVLYQYHILRQPLNPTTDRSIDLAKYHISRQPLNPTTDRSIDLAKRMNESIDNENISKLIFHMKAGADKNGNGDDDGNGSGSGVESYSRSLAQALVAAALSPSSSSSPSNSNFSTLPSLSSSSSLSPEGSVMQPQSSTISLLPSSTVKLLIKHLNSFLWSQVTTTSSLASASVSASTLASALSSSPMSSHDTNVTSNNNNNNNNNNTIDESLSNLTDILNHTINNNNNSPANDTHLIIILLQQPFNTITSISSPATFNNSLSTITTTTTTAPTTLRLSANNNLLPTTTTATTTTTTTNATNNINDTTTTTTTTSTPTVISNKKNLPITSKIYKNKSLDTTTPTTTMVKKLSTKVTIRPNTGKLLLTTMGNLTSAKQQQKQQQQQRQQHKNVFIMDNRKLQSKLVPQPLYIITPTYRRPEQLAELTRLGYTLKHVTNLLWLVIEDANTKKSQMVINTLNRIGVPYEYFLAPMPDEYKKHKIKPRGVSNRNRGLQWLRENASEGVFYFADDDNTYDISIFEQMRYTKKVSMWPVGLVTKLGISSPIVKHGKLVGFYDGWIGGRKYPVDMAGFAVSVSFLHQRPNAKMPFKAGYEEDGFLKSLAPLDNKDIELLASNCTEILTWHTQTKSNRPADNLNVAKYGDTNLVFLDKQLVRPLKK